MSTKLTFKQHLEALQKLREAVLKTPQRTATYNIHKYCKIPIGESKEDKQEIALKPKNKIIVEWLYVDVDNPTITSVKFDGVKDIETDQAFDMFWNGNKLQKWLNRNTTEEQIDNS